MPIPISIVVSMLFLIAPIYGILILLFDTHYRPHRRTILALGGGILLKCFALFGLVSLMWLFGQNSHAWILLLFILGVSFNVYQLMNETALHQ